MRRAGLVGCSPSPVMQASWRTGKVSVEMPPNQAITQGQTEKQGKPAFQKHSVSPSYMMGAGRLGLGEVADGGMLAGAEMLGFKDSTHSS